MQYLMKLVVIGKDREIIYRYLHDVPGGGTVTDFTELAPTPVCVVTKAQDHHAKAHVHMLSLEDPGPERLVSALAATYPALRFTLYYEQPDGYGTIHARGGTIESHAFRAK